MISRSYVPDSIRLAVSIHANYLTYLRFRFLRRGRGRILPLRCVRSFRNVFPGGVRTCRDTARAALPARFTDGTWRKPASVLKLGVCISTSHTASEFSADRARQYLSGRIRLMPLPAATERDVRRQKKKPGICRAMALNQESPCCSTLGGSISRKNFCCADFAQLVRNRSRGTGL